MEYLTVPTTEMHDAAVELMKEVAKLKKLEKQDKKEKKPNRLNRIASNLRAAPAVEKSPASVRSPATPHREESGKQRKKRAFFSFSLN